MDRQRKIGPLRDRTRNLGRAPARLLLLLFLIAGSARASGTVEMRDITVTPLGGRATITFLVDGPVATVVVEPVGANGAQVRMKSIRAGDAALRSALPKPGLHSISARIERTDVLVTDARFHREVIDIAVLRRDGKRVVVGVQLGRLLSPAEREGFGIRSVVIDPGHGGNDPGAIGLGGEEEKGITLKVALLLEQEMKRRMPGVEVILTRKSDIYVDLFRRGEIANEADADLFVSIHCNATEEKPTEANGFECWVWRPSPLGGGGPDSEQNHSGSSRPQPADAPPPGTRKSRALAGAVRGALGSGTTLKDRGTHQAGFYVLVGTNMPAVLVELGYLTNRNDLSYLLSTSGQKRVAASLVAGIREYGLRHARD